jgi:hypothetical protein
VQSNMLKKGKAILVSGRGGPYGCETSRLTHYLDNRLTDGGEVVSIKVFKIIFVTKLHCLCFAILLYFCAVNCTIKNGYSFSIHV